jgi:hypothetical protein
MGHLTKDFFFESYGLVFYWGALSDERSAIHFLSVLSIRSDPTEIEVVLQGKALLRYHGHNIKQPFPRYRHLSIMDCRGYLQNNIYKYQNARGSYLTARADICIVASQTPHTRETSSIFDRYLNSMVGCTSLKKMAKSRKFKHQHCNGSLIYVQIFN